MVHENKNNVMAAVAGAAVGAGAVIAGAVVLADKNNQKNLSNAIVKGQKLARNYANDVNEKVANTKEVVDAELAKGKGKAKKIVEIVKTAEKGVKNL